MILRAVTAPALPRRQLPGELTSAGGNNPGDELRGGDPGPGLAGAGDSLRGAVNFSGSQVAHTGSRRQAFVRARYRRQGELLMGCGDVHEDAAGYFALKCAWCRQVIGESNVKDSHGMCEACYRRELQIQQPSGGSTFGGGVEPVGE